MAPGGGPAALQPALTLPRCDLVEFCREIRKFRCASSRPSGVIPGLVAVDWNGPARNVADPQRSHELEAGQPSKVLGVPLPQLWVLRLLADNGVLHDSVAE
jgi:hypothetical protein